MKTAVRLALAFTIFVSATAQAGWGHDDESDYKVVSVDRKGPNVYHPTYNSVSKTFVVIQGFRLRTADGKVITVPSPRVEVNLQDLLGFEKGIKIDLSRILAPGQFVEVTEIEVNTVDCSNHRIHLGNAPGADPRFGKSCNLKVPKNLNFYIPFNFDLNNPTESRGVLMGNFLYLLKADFRPLSSIQLDLLRIIKKKNNCWSPWEGHQVCSDGKTKTSFAKSCEIVNRRHPIVKLGRFSDEA